MASKINHNLKDNNGWDCFPKRETGAGHLASRPLLEERKMSSGSRNAEYMWLGTITNMSLSGIITTTGRHGIDPRITVDFNRN